MNGSNTVLSGHIMNKSTKWEIALFVFLLFFLTSPYFFWDWYGNLFVNILMTTFALVLAWRHSKQIQNKQKALLVFYVLVWLFYLLNEFSKGARLGVVAYMPYVLLGLMPFIEKEFAKKVFNHFVTLYAVLIGLSMISWIAALTGLISPMGELGMGNEAMEAQKKIYMVYPLSLVSISGIEQVTRFCGFFDEPGMVGTIGGLILCALRYNMKDWRCIIVLLSGLLSTSMFFYGLTLVFWLSELILVRKKFGLLILLVLGIFTSYLVTKDNEAVSYLVWERFEWDSKKGDFKGNSRSISQSSSVLNNLTASGELWFGVKDKEAFWDDNFGSASIFNVIAMYGLVFVTLYITWLIAVGYHYRYNKWDYLLYCFAVVGCLYQRPDVFSMPHTFLFVCIARYMNFQVGSPISKLKKKKIIPYIAHA